MNSKIRVEMDFDTKEPYLQIYLESSSGDLADKTLKHFVARANHSGIEIKYPDALHNNNTPQIRLSRENICDAPSAQSIIVTETSEIFRNWLNQKGIDFTFKEEALEVFGIQNEFNFGVYWGKHRASLSIPE